MFYALIATIAVACCVTVCFKSWLAHRELVTGHKTTVNRWCVHGPNGVITVSGSSYEIDEDGDLLMIDIYDEEVARFPAGQWHSVWFGEVELRKVAN